ncbi:MAG: dihydropteroate synthase [Phycisphaerae bacterium]|nr:dihydropteroate synthase [Phycisphaerae bacterium]
MLARSTISGARPVRTVDTPHGNLLFGGRCLIMGVLNVTPDSFSDGGLYAESAAAIARAQSMASDGADVIDVGGESTRPGSQPVSADEQIERVVPVIRRMREAGVSVPVSVDTRSAEVAAAGLDAGADIVNDISAARDDPAMPRLLAERRVPFVVMHMQAAPATMQDAPHYDDVVAEIGAFFVQRAEDLAAAKVDVNQMIIDPGIGFGKTLQHNLALLRSIRSFAVRWPVLVGPSRKQFLGEILDEADPAGRLMGTAATVAHCALVGVDMVRVHDVKEMRQVVEVCHRIGTAWTGFADESGASSLEIPEIT